MNIQADQDIPGKQGGNLIIFDFSRTLYDPDASKLFDGVQDMLRRLRKTGAKVVVATKIEQERHELIAESNLAHYVDEVINMKEKTAEYFSQIARGYDPQRVWIIGDVLPAEIRIGVELNFHTIWVGAGKFADHGVDEVTPEYTVMTVGESEQLISA